MDDKVDSNPGASEPAQGPASRRPIHLQADILLISVMGNPPGDEAASCPLCGKAYATHPAENRRITLNLHLLVTVALLLNCSALALLLLVPQ